jgi:uncharacterized membrane protein/protein-disulfide isomerase
MPSFRVALALRVICLFALGVSSYLAWTAFTASEVAGCSAGALFDCSHVLSSRWSKILGIPVSVPAIGLYASLLALLMFVRRDAPAAFHRTLWTTFSFGALSAGAAALWFIGLQKFALAHYCPWCLSVHACGLLLSFYVLARSGLSLPRKSLVSAVAVSCAALMAVIQYRTPVPDNFTIERFPEVAVSDSGNDAPGDDLEFSAPDGLDDSSEEFSAPGDDVFDSPLDVGATQAVKATDGTTTSEAVKADGTVTATATLLQVIAPRLMFSNQMLFVPAQETAATASGTETAAADETASTSESADPGDATDAKAQDTSIAIDEPGTAGAPTDAKANAPPEPRKVTVKGTRKITLNVEQWPMLGSCEARYLFVEMFDYTCPHCRNTHFAIKGAQKHFGNDLAIVVLPVPLESSCNRVAAGGGHAGACELARIAVAVWRVDAERFREFHDWVFESRATPSTARAKAESLVGKEKFSEVYATKLPADYIKRHVDLYEKVGKGSVPKLMFPRATVSGEVNNASTLVRMIETELASAAP